MMAAIVIRLFDYMRKHRTHGVLGFILITLILAYFLAGQTYKEDISDFLPLNNKYHKALKVYQEISGANRIIGIFQYRDLSETDADTIIYSIERFVEHLKKNDKDKSLTDLTYQIDLEKVTETTEFVYRNIPYFLTSEDYHRIDSLLETQDYIHTQIRNGKQMLMLPVSGIVSENFQRDPLHLFTPIVSQLQKSQSSIEFENYDGYIFSKDMKRAFVMMTSPFGSSETEGNSTLLALLRQSADETESEISDVSIRFTGGPVIAVGNSKQIKTDSIIAVMLAIVLIVALLFYVFRSIWHLFLIVLSIIWGWLFAMGILSCIHQQVSVIVIGISSIIIGIAVNYPLHLIAHLQHTPDVRSALKEIIPPLVVGNITTVGAFLALVPLQSVALRDLGLFSSFLLVGTILFALIFLPHLLKNGAGREKGNIILKFTDISIENYRWVIYAIIVFTLFFGYLSLQTGFDTNMSSVNYLTDEQKADMAYFRSFAAKSSADENIYVVSADSTINEALEKSQEIQPLLQKLKQEGLIADKQGCYQFLCSKEEQRKRLEHWNTFVQKHGNTLEHSIIEEATMEGFSAHTFDDFFDILHKSYKPQDFGYFKQLSSSVFASNLMINDKQKEFNVIDVLKVSPQKIESVVSRIENHSSRQYVFDVNSMNTSIATRLSDDFNYIGWACGCIVFLFLWFSLGCLELAILSFIPMAVSWLWILGIMSLVGIQFNVVNIILATFIFGQGDDYTIFMTEGCQFEYAYRRKMLASYKNSIIISALIMLIGIGSLIIAKHPALHSLAEVTIIGMFSVVLMAYLFPPLIFRWLVYNKGCERKRPITLRNLIWRDRNNTSKIRFIEDCYRYKGVDISSSVCHQLRKYTKKGTLEKIESSITSSIKTIIIINNRWGELSMLLALENPKIKCFGIEKDEEKYIVAKYTAENRVDNLTISKEIDRVTYDLNSTLTILIESTDEDKKKYEYLNPIIIN
jgi:predicted exporter